MFFWLEDDSTCLSVIEVFNKKQKTPAKKHQKGNSICSIAASPGLYCGVNQWSAVFFPHWCLIFFFLVSEWWIITYPSKLLNDSAEESAWNNVIAFPSWFRLLDVFQKSWMYSSSFGYWLYELYANIGYTSGIYIIYYHISSSFGYWI